MRSISSKILGTILTTTLLVWTGTNAIADDAIPTYTISTIAGVGAYGKDGDGGPALEAKMNRPTSVAVDSKGYIYIADSLNRLVRMVEYLQSSKRPI